MISKKSEWSLLNGLVTEITISFSKSSSTSCVRALINIKYGYIFHGKMVKTAPVTLNGYIYKWF